MSLLYDMVQGPALALLDPNRAVDELAKGRALRGLYLVSAMTTMLGGIAAVRLAMGVPETADVTGISWTAIYRIGLGGAIAAGIVVPIAVPILAAFLPWLACEFIGKQTSYATHVHVLMVALAPALVVGNLLSFLVEVMTGVGLDSSVRVLLPENSPLAPAAGYMDLFLAWALFSAIGCYRVRLNLGARSAVILGFLGVGCLGLFHSVGIT